MRWTALALFLMACGGSTTLGPPAEGEAPETSQRVDSSAEEQRASALGSLQSPTSRADPSPSLPTGSLSREHIRRKMRSVVNEMRACYESRVLATQPDLEGRLVSSFLIAPDGTVEEVSFHEDAIGSAPLRECISSVLRGLRFDAPDGGGYVGVNYPWVFSVQD